MKVLSILSGFLLSVSLVSAGSSRKSNYGNVHESFQAYQKHHDVKAQDPNDEDMYFFTLHDYNRDHHLDGHELALAFMGYEFYEGEELEHEIPRADLETMIDNALAEDDKDNDGKISWAEYLESQKYR